MNGISAPAEPVYRTCYAYNSATGKMEFQTYNYTEMLEKMRTSTPPEGVTYWEPDEYGRVYIDPRHPRQAALECEDASGTQLPAPGRAALPGVNTRTEEKQRAQKKEERKEQDEQTRMLREERLKMARQEAMLHRLAQTALFAERWR